MKIYREQSFQKFKPARYPDGRRKELIQMDETAIRRVQRGTMHFKWRGVYCLKNPFDLGIYSQLLWELRPRTIIEIGYKFGGSALWFADQCDVLQIETQLFCVDVEQRQEFDDPRIEFVHGDGRDLAKTFTPEVIARLPRPWLIVEDADHQYVTTKSAIDFFAGVMEEGDYLAVEDGLGDTLGTADRYDGGPNRAIYDFLRDHEDVFEVDEEYCDFYGNNVTWCTNGYLRRTNAPAPHIKNAKD